MSANMMLTRSACATVTATREGKRFYASEHGVGDRTVLLPTVRFETQDGRTVETEISPLWYWEAPGFQNYPVWGLPVGITDVTGWLLLYIMFFIFPDGRFVPRWTRWLCAAGLLYFS
jgi:hypothetical protein